MSPDGVWYVCPVGVFIASVGGSSASVDPGLVSSCVVPGCLSISKRKNGCDVGICSLGSAL